MALFPCIIGSSGGTSIIDDGYYLLMSTSTPVSQTKISVGETFQVTTASGATKGALINCNNATASSLTISSSTIKCYVVGIKNKKEILHSEYVAGNISLSDYDYIVVFGGNGTKTLSFT